MTGRPWGWGGLVVWAAVAACAGARRTAAAERPAAAGVPVQLGFEPPLLQQGRLLVRHEAGPTLTVGTACTGVLLSLPPGPVFLRLEAGGRVHERTLVVESQPAEVLWTLAPR